MKYNRGSRKRNLFVSTVCFCIICAFCICFKGTDANAADWNRSDYVGDIPYNTTETEDTESTTPILDMTNVTLSKTSVSAYLVPTYSYGKTVVYGNAELDIAVNSPVILDETMEGVHLSCKSSNKKVRAEASLSNNILHLKIYGRQNCKTKLTVSIAEKKFQIKVSVKTVKISDSSLLLEKGNTKQLKIKGCSKGITWSSSNKKIATVSKKGVVKGKNIGNVIISAKIGNKRIGCAVSVTTYALKKVCERATYIGNNWQYSQAKRTQFGYYDCSALVWKAYNECAGVNFGSASYPGTSRSESAWCLANNRMIKGGYTYKKVLKMQLNPGDLVFKSTNPNDPYHTTYHVEMFTGYICLGYNSNGKPTVTSLWASRSAGYGAEDGSLLARPMN